MFGNPNLKHKELEALYQHGFDIPKTTIEEILSLPRESLIEDLKEVLLEAIRNFKNYGAASDNGAEEHLFIAPIHAFFLLGELEAESALPVFEQFLEQDENVVDFWLGDVLTEMIWQPIYEITKEDISRVIPFLKKPMKDIFAKSGHEMALFNYLQLHPEDRASLMPIIRDLVNELMGKAKEKEGWDEHNESLNSIAEAIMDEHCVELENELKVIVEADLLELFVPTEWVEVKDALHEPADSPEPLDIFQKYEAIKSWFSYVDLDDEEFDGAINYEDFLNGSVKAEKLDMTSFYANNTPYKKTELDVGRNDPCTCGSGKKFKKCCLRK